MIHEILAALSGSPGDIITEQKNDEGILVFAVLPTVSFISSSERVAINRLVQAGYTFHWLSNAVRKRKTSPSLYVRALVHRIDVILTEYLDLLVAIEADALQNPGEVTVAHLQSRVRSFDIVFSVLRKVIETIHTKKLVGGQVLNLLHKHSNTGMPDVKARLTQLANQVLRVFYSQLVSWVSHGVLVDDHNEFMITQRMDNFEGGESGGTGSEYSRKNGVYSNRSSYGRRTSIDHDVHLLKRQYNPVDAEHEWNTKYTLRLSMVPTQYVRYSFAQKALFVGKAMMILKQLDLHSVQDLEKQGDKQTEREKPMTPTTDDLSVSFSNSIDSLRLSTEFPSQPLEAALEQARIQVNKRLWWLTVRVAKLPLHLKAIKDYFLMWRGEFYQRFMVESFDLLKLDAPTSKTEIDLNTGPMQRAATTVGIESNPYFERFYLRLYTSKFHFYDFRLADTHRLTTLGDISTNAGGIGSNGKRNGTFSTSNSSEGISNDKSLCLVGGSSSSSSSVARDVTRGSKQLIVNSSPTINSRVSAIWHTNLMVVEYGFDTILHAKLKPSSSVSFIVQTDRLASISRHPSALENSFVVTCSLSSDCTTIIKRVTMKSRNKKNKQNNIIELSEAVINVADVVDVAKGETKQTTGTEKRDQLGSVKIRLRVVYRRMGSTQLKDLCQVYIKSSYLADNEIDGDDASNQKSMASIEWIPTKDEGSPFVEFPLELRNELVLSPTANGGGAWVGILGTSSINLLSNATTADNADNGNVVIYGWAFDAKQKHVYNNFITSKSEQMPLQQQQQQQRHRDVGCCLEGSYRVAWPIHLIVTQNALSQYNAVFQFLFSIGRVSSLLRGAWAVLMESKSQTRCAMHASRLRSRMAFLVDSLQYYFHVDVIATQWHYLDEILQETENSFDFEKVQTGHAKFLASISRQCLLHVRTVRDALDQVLDACNDLCACICDESKNLEEEHERIQEIDAQYTRCSSYLFLVLSGISEKLLLRLDFNAHFSSKASDLGGAVSAP
jgi:hypothetical protein